jgi:putative membrane protein insertion efficiency factor
MIKRATRLPAQALLAAIRLYQWTLAPFLPVLAGPGCGCRFAPSCSHYAAEAIRTQGAIAGGWLALRRVARCTPFHPGGLDPVPPSPEFRRAGLAAKPRCVRIPA